MMAKFNGKKGKNRNLAESVLNAYFNSAGIGTKGSKPVKKKVPTMSHGGPPPHPPQQQTGFLLDQLQRYGQPGYQMNSNMGTAEGQIMMAQAAFNAQQAGANPYTGYTPDPLAQNSQVLLPQGQSAGTADWSTVNYGNIGGGYSESAALQGQNQNLWNTNAVGTGNFGTIQNPNMGGFNTGIGGETGLGMEGAGLNYNVPTPGDWSTPPAKTGLAPGQVAKAQADHLKKEGLQALGAQALGSFGTMIAQSDDTTDNVRPSSSGRDILGSAMSGAAGGMALGPYGALAGAAIGVGTELFASNKAGKQWDEDMLERRENRQSQMGDAALEYSNYMKGTYNSQGGDNYYAKDGGPVAKLLKKYGHGGPSGESDSLVYDSPLTDAEMKEWMLAMKAGEQMSRFTNTETQQPLSEWHPDAANYIQNELLPDAGFGLRRQNLQTEDGEGTPWSAATVSGLGQVVDPNFPVSAAHSTYINSAFQNKGDWSANKTPLLAKNANYNVGDILFQGRGENKGKGFNWFQKQSELNDGEGASYPSHSDMIIGTHTNERGKVFYDVQGGNVGDTLSTKSYNARQLNKKYKGFLNYNDPSMALGGATGQAEYETEGGEVMLASPGDAPVAVGNGNYKQVASNLYQAEGPAHEGGGIATQGATEPFMDASGQSHDSPYVFSDSEDMTFDATDILKLIS